MKALPATGNPSRDAFWGPMLALGLIARKQKAATATPTVPLVTQPAVTLTQELPEEKQPLPWYLWAGISLAVVGIVTAIVLVIRKKK